MTNKRVLQAPRGLKDILPEEQKYWFWLENAFNDTAQAAGFERIIMPTFETTDLFKRSVGEFTDIVDKEMYVFKDKGGNSMALRPEGTAGVARAYIEHGMNSLPQPVKLFYWGPMFRYDRPQAGRFREFYQFGLEVLGDSSPLTDALLIQAAVKYYQKLGVKDLIVKINSLGTDKSKNKIIAALTKFLTGHKKSLCSACKVRLKKNVLRVLDCKVPGCKKVVETASGLVIDNLDPESKKRFTKVLEHLDELEVSYELDPTLVRGIDYYTHTLFELVVQGQESLSIGGGGRYDNLIQTLGGPDTPAIGYAGGVERTIDILKQQAAKVPEIVKTDVFIVQLGGEAKAKAIEVAKKLEEINLRVSTSLGRGSIQSQLSAASRLNSFLAVIIGDREVHDKTIILRDMHDRSQETIPDRNIARMVIKKLEEKGIRLK